MIKAKRIGEHLLDIALRDLLESTTKIFPIEYSDIEANLNPHNYEFARVVSGPFKNNIYYWEQGPRKWSLIGADVISIKWNDIEGVPGEFKPTEHKHTEEDITNLNKYTREEIDLKLNEFTLTIDLQRWLDDKVDKVMNKQLSTEDFTSELKSKLEALSDNASIDYNQMLVSLNTHINDLSKHLTSAMIDSINTIGSKVSKTTFEGHTGNASVHVTQIDKDSWNDKANNLILEQYSKNVADLPLTYPMGISIVFVSANEGWANYGTVMTVRGYSGGGGTYQVYTPYGANYGGKHQKIRYSEYAVNAGNSWTEWKSVGNEPTIGTVKPTNGSLWFKKK